MLFLINQGLNVNGDDPDGFSPLMSASRSRHDSIVELLIKNGAKVNLQTKNGMTALHFGTEANSTSIADMLVKAGGDPTIKNNRGITALHHVVALCDSDSDFNRNMGKEFCRIFKNYSVEFAEIKQTLSDGNENLEDLKKPFLSTLKSLETPILLEKGNMIESWGDCTIISNEGISYEPGGDTKVITGPFKFTQSQIDAAKEAIR